MHLRRETMAFTPRYLAEHPRTEAPISLECSTPACSLSVSCILRQKCRPTSECMNETSTCSHWQLNSRLCYNSPIQCCSPATTPARLLRSTPTYGARLLATPLFSTPAASAEGTSEFFQRICIPVAHHLPPANTPTPTSILDGLFHAHESSCLLQSSNA